MFSENRAVYETMWKKYGRARRATDENRMQCGKDAICVPDN